MPHIEDLHTTARTAAPGWSYVVDTGHDPSKLAINPSSRKRLRTTAASGLPSAGDLTLRQQTAIQRHLAELDRDNIRDGGAGGPVAVPKSKLDATSRAKTANVRRILLSGKDFAYYVEEEQAWLAQRGGAAVTSAVAAVDAQPSHAPAAAARGSSATVASAGTAKSKPPQRASKTPIARRKSAALTALTATASSTESTPLPSAVAAPPTPAPPAVPSPTPAPAAAKAAALPLSAHSTLATQDSDSLLAPAPALHISAAEIATLLAAPPLTYAAARSLPPPASAPPRRVFCEICGFWGRVKCMKCGARVCGLECRAAHDESRCVKFYA